MNPKEMTIEQIEARQNEILAAIETPDADLNALKEEMRSLREELEARKAAEAKKAEIRAAVADGQGKIVKTFQPEKPDQKTPDEIRSSEAYMEAYKNYIITGNDAECRALLTMNATGGTVPAPSILDNGVKTEWEKDGIMSRVTRTFVRGNLKVAFEKSADPAVVHTEGTNAPAEEELTLGVVELIPENIKKWITISDEAVAMGGEEFLRYIYDEITYQIVKKAAALAITDVTGAPTAHTASAIGVAKVSAAPSVTAVPTAAANLSDEATDIVVVMNRLTEVDFLAAAAAGNFAVDPFAGLQRVYTSALPAYSAASAGAVYAIVGNLNAIQFNFPEGEGVIIKWDDLSLSEKDMVKVVGRQYAAHKVTKPGRLCNIAKPQ